MDCNSAACAATVDAVVAATATTAVVSPLAADGDVKSASGNSNTGTGAGCTLGVCGE